MKSLIFFTLILEGYLLLGKGWTMNCANWSLPHIVAEECIPQRVNLLSAGMDTYETGVVNGTKALILVYGALDFDKKLRRLGSLRYRVIMPDFFHGGHIPINQSTSYCPLNISGDDLPFTWNGTVRNDLAKVLQTYKFQGVHEFGIFGFCFGLRMSALAEGEFADDIKVAGQFHPFGTNIRDSFGIERPNLLLPGANDPDMVFYVHYFRCIDCMEPYLKKVLIYRLHTMEDVNHGLAGNTGVWTNETVRVRAEEALEMWEQFLCKKFPPAR